MKRYLKPICIGTLFLSVVLASHAAEQKQLIGDQYAIKQALAALEFEVIGIRFDEPDLQWDVFIKSKGQAYEIEVDAYSGKVLAIEEESLEEIRAELAGQLLHEGIDGDIDK